MTTEIRIRVGSNPNWRISVIKQLDGRDALRMLTTRDLKRLVGMHSEISEPTFKSFVNVLCDNQYLLRISRGVYVNPKALPRPSVAEAAHQLRPGCVVSLQTVLGDCGFINNPSAIVMAITSDHGVKYSGLVETSGNFSFQFRYIPSSLSHIAIGGLDDKCKFYQRATPERALADWIYLANSPNSPMTFPPIDVDMSVLDFAKAKEIGERMGIKQVMQSWYDNAESLGFGDEYFTPKEKLPIQKQKVVRQKKASACIQWC